MIWVKVVQAWENRWVSLGTANPWSLDNIAGRRQHTLPFFVLPLPLIRSLAKALGGSTTSLTSGGAGGGGGGSGGGGGGGGRNPRKTNQSIKYEGAPENPSELFLLGKPKFQDLADVK